ncbi:MAG: hypothetical protein ACLFR0_02570 [Alphaproteobacteria bacterium]
MMDLLHDSNVWLVFSFIIFCFILLKYGKKAFLSMLDKRIEDIKTELSTSETLRVEAQELLAQYQRKQRDAEKEAEQIIAKAEQNALQIRKKAEEDLIASLKRKEQQMKERIQQMEESVIQEIREHAANLAVEATTQIIIDKLGKKDSDKLLDSSIKQAAQNLH